LNDDESRSYSMTVPREYLMGLGYPVDEALRGLRITIRRPQQIPSSVGIEGVGISGKDWIIEDLKLPIETGSSEERFLKELERKGIETREPGLGYRPAHLVLAFPSGYEITSYEDVRDTARRLNKSRSGRGAGGRFKIVSEFEYLTEQVLSERSGLRHREYELGPSHGKTEGFSSAHDSDGILDVAESGSSIIANDLVAVYPPVVGATTPYLLINSITREKYFPKFIRVLEEKLYEGRDLVRKEHPELFEGKLAATVFGSAFTTQTPSETRVG
jgi:ATP phosphoribosyltransferase